MKIKFNAYKKKDGSWMIFVNNDRKVSIGISEEKGMLAPYGKNTTEGQRKLINVIPQALESAEGMNLSGVPNFEAHNEPKARLPIGELYITDVATIGGVNTGSDGAFLVTKENKIINLTHWIDLPIF